MSNHGMDLLRAGYRDLVLIRKGQKAPAHKGWPDIQPEAGAVRGWGGGFGLNARYFPGIDIDIEPGHGELASQLVQVFHKQLGPAPLRLSYAPESKLLVYRTEEPFPKKVLHLPDGQGKVEVLGEGRQYVVVGEHPDGPPHYRWYGADLWEWDPDLNLTLITEEQVDELLDKLAETLEGFVGRKSKAADVVVAQEKLLAPNVEVVEALVAALPNTDEFLAECFPQQPTPRDYWVAMGHAIKGAAGDAGEEAFVEWTSRYEDGPVDLEDARAVYQGLQPERYGWPTLQRIERDHMKADPAEVFELEPAPEGYEPPEPPVDFRRHVDSSDEFYTERVIKKAKGELVYMAGGWRLYEDGVWVDDDTKEGLGAQLYVRSVLRDLGLQIEAQAALCDDEKIAGKMFAKARGLQSSSKINAVHGLLKAPLLEQPEAFDQNEMELNTPAGVVDLVTGQLRPSSPRDLMTRMTRGAPTERYDPAKAPVWERFLDHLTDGDRELRGFLQRYAGYALTGRVSEKKFIFLWGSHTHTGKSTFLNALSYAMGTYAKHAPIELFMGGMGGDRKGQYWAELAGVRLVTSTEPSIGHRWDDSAIKAVTGGDPVTARRLYFQPFEYNPAFKILISGNNEPELKVVDEAMLGRILVTPANNVVPPEKMDGEMDLKLEAEADQILAWCMAGCRQWQEHGLQPSSVVIEATQNYADEEDRVGQWLTDCCDVTQDADDFVTTAALYNDWLQWCNARGVDPMNASTLGRELVSRLGLSKGRSQAGRGYHGIRLQGKRALLGENVE